MDMRPECGRQLGSPSTYSLILQYVYGGDPANQLAWQIQPTTFLTLWRHKSMRLRIELRRINARCGMRPVACSHLRTSTIHAILRNSVGGESRDSLLEVQLTS